MANISEKLDDPITHLSKKIVFVLRHGAKELGVAIDEDGWVSLHELLTLRRFENVTEDFLLDMLGSSYDQRKRFQFKSTKDGTKFIRAVRKHSIEGIDLAAKRSKRVYKAEPKEELDDLEDMTDMQLQQALQATLGNDRITLSEASATTTGLTQQCSTMSSSEWNRQPSTMSCASTATTSTKASSTKTFNLIRLIAK